MRLERTDGYAPIGAYALLGGGRSTALVASDGAVDWFASPTLDAPPLCAAILDPKRGGSIMLSPSVPYDVTRRYVDGTTVLETTFATDAGQVRVTDALTRGSPGLLPWTELARRVEADGGAVPMRWQVAPGHRFGSARPWAHRRREHPALLVGDQQLAVLTDRVGEAVVGDHAVHGEFTARPGERGLLAVVATDAEPIYLPDPAGIQSRIDHTVAAWQHWCGQIDYTGPHQDAVARSALVLKMLTLAPSAALAAAPTTSLPEQIGGKRNFDYRFAWVRDAGFALDVLTRLRLEQEVHASLSWLLAAVARTAPDVHTFYTLEGSPAAGEITELEELRGYRDSQPVQVGNSAASQRQLGGYGDLFGAVWRYVRHGGHLDAGTGRMLAELADRVCDLWSRRDAGLWELGSYRHYTSSKINCWVALDRAVRLADAGQLASLHVERWRCEREAIRRRVEEHHWSTSKQAYAFHAGSDDLDAAVLLAARTGFLAGGDPRLLATIDAIRRELTADGPLLYRYSGQAGKEGAFLACSFWLVEALAHTGRHDEARELLDGVLAHANDVGLFSEEIDPVGGQLLGNFPQGLTHLALIGAVTALADTEGGRPG